MAEPRLMRTAPAAASSATGGAPGQAITATGSGPLASSAIAAGLTSPGTNKLSPPPAATAAARARASSIRRGPARNTSGRAFVPHGTPPPTARRSRRHRADRLAADGGLTLRLPVVPGYDWDAVRAFLAARLVPGVEAVDGDTYRRTITMAGAPGLLEVSPGRENCLLLRVHLPYWEGLIHVVDRVGLLLGVERDHSAGGPALSGDPVLGPPVPQHPSLAA